MCLLPLLSPLSLPYPPLPVNPAIGWPPSILMDCHSTDIHHCYWSSALLEGWGWLEFIYTVDCCLTWTVAILLIRTGMASGGWGGGGGWKTVICVIPAESSSTFTKLASHSGHWRRREHWQCDSWKRWNISKITQTTHVVWPVWGKHLLSRHFGCWMSPHTLWETDVQKNIYIDTFIIFCIILCEIFNKQTC